MEHSGGAERSAHVIPALVSFVFASAAAIVLFISAGVVWLSEALDSAIWAMVIVGAFMALLSGAVYFVFVRTAMARVRERIETVYDVARSTREAYEWVLGKYRFVRLLLALLTRNYGQRP